MTKTCKELKERMPRNKYRDIDRARLAYAKQRKHTKAATDKLLRRLLNLLSKQIGQCLGIHMANSAILAARQLGHRRKGEETSKTTSIKNSAASRPPTSVGGGHLYSSNSKTPCFMRRELKISRQIQNHTDIRPSRAFPRLKIQAIN